VPERTVPEPPGGVAPPDRGLPCASSRLAGQLGNRTLEHAQPPFRRLKSMPDSARLESLLRAGQQSLLRGGLKGLEKESLRLSVTGRIAQTPHPATLGSALTHPWITTDYSEALIELITPPFSKIEDTLNFLGDLHAFVHQRLEEEVLLATSMPIGLDGDSSIPIARYGHSNIGMMKHIYRRGLAHRYGRTMQAIAGLHYNYSFNEALWPTLQDLERNRRSPAQYIADAYFGVIRNIHRHGWLLIYLFGSSPAICKSFFKGREALATRFTELDHDTLYRPHATSLRMSDIGYRNDTQTSLAISFDSLEDYVESLERAILQPYPTYEKIGVKVDGVYRQLNANILQIENEYYSAVRPKQVTRSGEKPTLALKKRGVRYLELRALDLIDLAPEGITRHEMRFLEIFLLFCLLTESPPLGEKEITECNQNSLGIACCGRGESFRLIRQGREIPLSHWGNEIFEYMLYIAEILDEDTHDTGYIDSIKKLRTSIMDSEDTPSARVLKTLRQNHESFAAYALRLSSEHAGYWRNRALEVNQTQEFRHEAEGSWRKQEQIEASDSLSLDEFLQQYWLQT
jgi:glutamate--cysteine ligase